MTANAVELIDGIANTANVSKAGFVSWAKARVPQVVANATEVRNTTLALQLVLFIKALGQNWFLDTTDTTTADDGVNCIISADGFRFKPLSSIPTPSTGSLGGVFSSAAVTHQYVTGLDTSGNLLRAQPSSADLSDGNDGTGAIVHATGATLSGAALTDVTALGIRSTGAAFDLTFASSEVLTAGRTLSWVVGDAARTVTLGGNLTLAGALTTSGAFGLTLTQTAATSVTLPTAGTLATLAGTETLTNKSVNASNNTITNLTTAMFATNVVDTDGTLSAASTTRIPSQSAVKTYVDTVAQGLDPKQSVLVATTANITLSGEQTIDGVLTSASRILVKNQTTASQNGIYVTGTGSWTRSLDADTWAELPGAFVFVEQGTTNDNTGWTCTVNAGGTLGTTAVTFVQFAGAGTYTAGTGLTLTGTVFAIDATVATLTGSQALTNKTYNGNTWTSGTGVLTLGAGKTFTASNTLTFTGTDSTVITFQGTDTYVGRATTDTLTNKTLTNPTLSLTAPTANGQIGFDNGVGLNWGDGTANHKAVSLDQTQTITGAKTFNSGKLLLAGSTSGTTTLNANATAGTGTVVLPTTGTLATLAGAEAFTNKTYSGNTWTTGTGTLTLGAGKTLTASNTLTFTGTDGSSVSFGAGGTVAYAGATSTGDANYTILSTDRLVYHTALTAARTDTLPAASSVQAGQIFVLNDFDGVCSASHTITLARAGSDLINGVTSVVAIGAQYGAGIFWSDGVSRWTFFPASSGGGSGTVSNVATAGLATGGPITSTGTVTVTGAVKSDQTTATSTTVAVVPAVQQNHPSATKLWGTVNQTGTQAILSSYNVSSITDSGVGQTTFNASVAFASTAYATSGMLQQNAANGEVLDGPYTPTTGGFRVAATVGSTLVDEAFISVSAFGPQ